MEKTIKKKRGVPKSGIAKVQKIKVLFRPAMWQALEKRAAEEGLTLNMLIERYVVDGLNADGVNFVPQELPHKRVKK